MPRLGKLSDCSNEKIQALAYAWIHSERDRAIICRHFCDGVTYETLSQIYKISTRQVGYVIRKGKRELEKHVI